MTDSPWTEQPMPGGRTLGAVRVGDTVRRPVHPWTPSVQAVLRHLESVGYAGAPRVLGFDDQGREVLSFLDGETVGDRLPWPAWALADETLEQVGEWLARLHEATRAFVPPRDAVWFGGQSWQPGLVVGHHDAAPYNAVWRDGRLVGFVDWDTAGPSSRELDLAFAALSWVPFQLHAEDPPWDAAAVGQRRRRLHLLLDAYGYPADRSQFGSAVAGRARLNAAGIRRLSDGGDPVYAALLPYVAGLERSAREVEALPQGFWAAPGG